MDSKWIRENYVSARNFVSEKRRVDQLLKKRKEKGEGGDAGIRQILAASAETLKMLTAKPLHLTGDLSMIHLLRSDKNFLVPILHFSK